MICPIVEYHIDENCVFLNVDKMLSQNCQPGAMTNDSVDIDGLTIIRQEKSEKLEP